MSFTGLTPPQCSTKGRAMRDENAHFVWTFACEKCGAVHYPVGETPLAAISLTCEGVGKQCANKDTNHDR